MIEVNLALVLIMKNIDGIDNQIPLRIKINMLQKYGGVLSFALTIGLAACTDNPKYTQLPTQTLINQGYYSRSDRSSKDSIVNQYVNQTIINNRSILGNDDLQAMVKRKYNLIINDPEDGRVTIQTDKGLYYSVTIILSSEGMVCFAGDRIVIRRLVEALNHVSGM